MIVVRAMNIVMRYSVFISALMAQVLRILLELGAVVNARNGDGYTPLHVAALWGRAKSVRHLLEKGADPFISDDDGMTPLDHAEAEGT